MHARSSTPIRRLMIATAALFAIPAPAYAHSTAMAALRERIGPTPTVVAIESGALEEDESATITFTVDPAAHGYWIYTHCVDGCDDLDVTVADSGGAPLADDFGFQDMPVVSVEGAKTGGRIQVGLNMVSCPNEVCGWAVALVKQD